MEEKYYPGWYKENKKVRIYKKYPKHYSPKYKKCIEQAKKRNIDVLITNEDYTEITSKPCVYCGTTHNIGVDRIDSSGCYEIDNCQPCCGRCNMMKYTMLHQEFLDHISKIYQHCLLETI